MNIPEDFDDIIEIAVDEQTQAIQNGEEEMMDEDGKPFWMRYFKADYLGDTDPAYQKLLANAGIQSEDNEEAKAGNQQIKMKLQEELMKIKSLDKQLVSSNKVYRTMKDRATIREQEIRDKMERDKREEKKMRDEKNKSYIHARAKRPGDSRGSSRSKASTSSKNSTKNSTKNMKNSKGFSSNPFTGMRRPSSGRKSAKPEQRQILDGKVEEDKGATFLTGVHHNAEKVANLDKRMKEELDIDVPIDNDDYDFDHQRTSELDMINAYEAALNQNNRRKYFDEESSQSSTGSQNSPSKVDFIRENVDKIGAHHHKSYTDRLSENQKRRLLELEDEIDQSFFGNEETAKKILAIANKPEKEKLELMSALIPASEAGETGVIAGTKNAFVYEDGERMERINDELKTKYLALPPPSDDETVHDDVSSMYNFQSSVYGDKKGNEKSIDANSQRSAQLSMFSKRSGISNFSHSIISKLSKPISLPKEKILREKAEEKLYKQSIKDIDSCLDQVRSSHNSQHLSEDQMSRLVSECQKEKDRISMLEATEEDEDDDNYSGAQQDDSRALVLYEYDNSKL